MAQLTWREVQAPQLSTRDLALAGQTMLSGFDRLSATLSNREEALRKKATDEAVSAAYMAQDPAAIAQLRAQGMDGLGTRVDRLAYAQALGTAENQLLERTKVREEVADLQAFAQMGDEQARYVTLLGQGRRDEANVFAAQMAEQNPDMWGRVAYGTAKDGEGVFDSFDTRRMTGLRDAETARSNQADEAGSAADRALRARAIGNDEASRARLEKGNTLGIQLAERLRTQSTQDATAALYETPEFKNGTREERMGIMETFTNAHGAYSSEDAGTRQGLSGLDRQIGGRLTALEAEGNRAEQASRNPMIEALRRADGMGDKLDMGSLTADLAERGGWQFTQGMAKDMVTKIQSDVLERTGTKPTLADVQAALDLNGFAEGFGKNIPTWNEQVFSSETAALGERVQQAVEARVAGYNANAEVDAKSARAESAGDAAALTSAREQLGRLVRAQKAGQLSTSQLMEMEQLERRVARLSAPDKK